MPGDIFDTCLELTLNVDQQGNKYPEGHGH